MASSSGTSSVSPPVQTSVSKENLIDQRKRKRMQSNRESARRSRMRKQKHLDDLTAQIARLSKENNQILTSTEATTQHYVKMEAENSILIAQMMEITQRLQFLNEILKYINSSAATAAAGSCVFETEEFQSQGFDDGFLNAKSWSWIGANQQPIMASAEMIDYYY